MAGRELAARHERQALSPVRCHACPCRRRTAAAHWQSGQQHLPGEEVWLVGEHRSTGERKYYLSNLLADTPLKKLAGAIKARWVCEQAHQQLKEELGLDHFEGRSWQGLHRHAIMTMIAFSFLQARRLKTAGRKKTPQLPRRNRAYQLSGRPS